MTIAAIICPNGLGHFKSMVLLLKELSDSSDEVMQIDLFCCRWQYEAMIHDGEFSGFLNEKCKPVYAMEVCGVRWHKETHAYTSGNLMDWTGYINALYRLQNYDLVLSDNLVQTLSLRSDTILIASFFWSDIFAYSFPGIPVIQQFVSLERELLSKHTPLILANRFLAMDRVKDNEQVKLLDWMCPPIDELPSKRSEGLTLNIGIFAGATDVQRNAIQQVASTLSSQGTHRLFMRKEDILPIFNAEEFDYSKKAWQNLDGAIIRAGTGTLTDCVAYNIPTLLIEEKDNLEISNNIAKMEALDAGTSLDVYGKDASSKINTFLSGEARKKALDKLQSFPKDGLKQAVKELAGRLQLALK